MLPLDNKCVSSLPMKSTIVLSLLFCATTLYAQQTDFETSSFEITAVAMDIETSSRLLISAKKFTPSRFKLTDVRSSSFNKITTPLVYRQQPLSSSQEIPSINYKVPTLSKTALSIWANRGSQTDNTGSVPNIAYEAALQGNFFDAYCTALYTARSGN